MMKKLVYLLLVAALVLGLCGCVNISISTDSSSSTSTQESSTVIDGYTVCCYEEDGKTPVEGASVQLCTDKMCNMLKTDSNGEAFFKAEAGEWDVHLDKVPEGYQKPAETAVKTSPTEGTVTFLIPVA